MGLLGDFDYLPQDPEKRQALSMGLLNFGANMMMNADRGFAPALGTGLLGGAYGYHAQLDNNRAAKAEDLRLKTMQGQYDDQEKVRSFYSNLSQFVPSRESQALAAGAKMGSVGPTVQNAALIDKLPAPQFDAQAMYQAMLRSGSPTLAQAGMQGLSREEEAFTLAPGQKRFKGSKVVAEVGPEEKLPDGMRIGANGQPEWIPGYLDGKVTVGRASAANNNVILPKIEVKTGESLAGQIGPMMKDSAGAADAAVKQVDAAQRIVRAIDSNKIFAGPGASTHLRIAQIGDVLGVTGKDTTEKIANTRQAIRGLAELTLQGRQQMRGQGAITESESALAEKAMSGDIDDLTPLEIRQLAGASERAARHVYGEHQRKLKVMQENPNLQGLSAFYTTPEIPSALPAAPAGVRRYNPATGRIE